ncbi:MAG: HRDC domain-containing protein [Dehalococcoidales bacterium]|nr:HRDC domain-containing protein [Dehalococcoidales bacterium]
MTGSPALPVEIVSQPDKLVAVARDLADSDIIALDTESNSRHYYPEQLCLVQIASRHKIYIIDTISLNDLTPIKGVLVDLSIKKVIHTADYDIRCLDRHSGIHIHNLFDPSIAARFIGVAQFGLAALTRDLLGITINKSERLQKSDWGRRPLSAEAIEYAATDVSYLIALQEMLAQRLRSLGREEWVSQEFAQIEKVRYIAPDLETAYLSIKGVKDLGGREMAVLQSLVIFREEQARRWHRPPFYVIPDASLIFLATNPSADFSEVPGLGQVWLKRFGQGLRQAILKGLTAPPITLPPRNNFVRLNKEQVQRLNRLKEWRKSLGFSLSLDPSLLWSLTSLERLASAPDTLSAEISLDNICSWQREVVVPSLRSCLESLK